MKFILSTIIAFFVSISCLAANYTIEVKAASEKLWKIKSGSVVIATSLPNPNSTLGSIIYMSTLVPGLKINAMINLGESPNTSLRSINETTYYYTQPGCIGDEYVMSMIGGNVTVSDGVYVDTADFMNRRSVYVEPGSPSIFSLNAMSKKTWKCENGDFSGEAAMGVFRSKECTVGTCGFNYQTQLNAVYE